MATKHKKRKDPEQSGPAQKNVAKSGSARWKVVPNADRPGQFMWEWDPSAEDDMDALFARVQNSSASDEDAELFDACMIDRFVARVRAGQPVEPWIMKALVRAFHHMLQGSEWNDELRLPGRRNTPVRPWREDRDLQIFCDVANAIGGAVAQTITAIEAAALKNNVSFETARAAYYKWRKKIT